MSWFSSFMHPERGYEKGQEELNNYFQQAQNAQRPYNQHGKEQYANLNEYIQSLMDPKALEDKWISGYQESEAAKNAEQAAQEHGLGAISNMGLMGSNSALNALQKGTTQIGLEDRQNYLKDLMEKYMQGAGLSQNIYNTGANTASNMGTNAMTMGQNSAQLAYGRENAGGDMFGKLLGTGIGAGGGALGSALAKRWNLSGGK